MRGAVFELRLVEREQRAAAEAPVEMRVGGGEMVEEPLAAGEHGLGDGEFLKELLLRQALYRRLRIRQIANELRRVDAEEEGMDAGGTKGKDRDRFRILHRVFGQELGLGKIARNPDVDRGVLGQGLAVDDQGRYLVL